jgi:molybdate transport system regulatory protein
MKRLALKPRFRVMAGRTIALGPGKMQLLQLVEETGSLRQAAKKMGMSYMRAWTLLRTMNRCFTANLVVSIRGGRRGGGAQLTPMGEKVLGLYREMERASVKASGTAWAKLRRCLAP